jgi:hypothetical protein
MTSNAEEYGRWCECGLIAPAPGSPCIRCGRIPAKPGTPPAPAHLESALLPVGTRIRFTQALTSGTDDFSPGNLYARAGEGGVVTGHGCSEGYWVGTTRTADLRQQPAQPCVHRWTVDGVRNPAPGQLCDHGCGTRWQPAQPQPQRTFHSKSEAKRVTALMQQPAQPNIETRIPTAAEVDERIEVVSSREYRSGFNDCRLVFAQPTIDRLQSALAAAQQKLSCGHPVALDDSYGGCVLCKYRSGYEEYERELTAAQQRIADLESELENERARGIHTCHDQCQRPLCVAGRRIRELEALNAERNRQNAAAWTRVDDLRAALLEAIEIMVQGERLLPKGEARFRAILEGRSHHDPAG